MAERDEREHARRAAYAAYNRLLWRLAQLPVGAPGRAALVAELADAGPPGGRWRRVGDVGPLV